MGKEFTYTEVPTGLPEETALDVASTIATVVPWIGGPVANVLSGLSFGRKIGRVHEILEGLKNDLRDFKSEASEAYVKTDEFEELLENTLRRAADERNEEKRRLLGSFLVAAVKQPGEPYDEQKRFLRLIEELQPAHMVLLRVLAQAPEAEEESGMIGSVRQTLRQRAPEIPDQTLDEVISQMNALRITNITSLNTVMTAHGAADLRHNITAPGKRLASYILQQ